MKKLLVVIIVSVLVLTFSSVQNLSFAKAKVVNISKIQIELYTKRLNLRSLPLLSRGVLKYLKYSKRLKNDFRQGSSSKDRISVRIMKYKKGKYVILSISNKAGGTRKSVTVWEDHIRYREKLSKQEKALRKEIKRDFKREELSEKQAKLYLLITLYISEGIDKALLEF